MRYKEILVLALMAVVASMPASSATITVEKISENLSVISINGPIEIGDGRDFMKLAVTTGNAIVNLNSPGGLVGDGLTIAEQIYSSGFDTYVADKSECLSMCAIIWLSGKQRFLTSDSELGFHGAYIESEQGFYSVNGPGNAKIGSFLGKMNLSQTAISFITEAKPDEFNFVDFERAQFLGLGPKLLSGDPRTELQTIMSPIDAIKVAAQIVFFDTACLSLFPSPNRNLMRYHDAFIRYAEEVLGYNTASTELNLALINVSKSFKNNGLSMSCVTAELVLRSANIPTGINGPSFDCAMYNSAAHQTLCSSPSLWAADIVMNSIYWNIRQGRIQISDA